jgi:hypothetical protein
MADFLYFSQNPSCSGARIHQFLLVTELIDRYFHFVNRIRTLIGPKTKPTEGDIFTAV